MRLSLVGDSMAVLVELKGSSMDNRAQWLHTYVERCLDEAWGDNACLLGRYGDVTTFRFGTAACIVRVEADEPLMVRVLAKAVLDVRLSAKLLREINDINAGSRVAHVWWHDGDVVVERSLFADAVSVGNIHDACLYVGGLAHDLGVGFAAMYDGRTPYPPLLDDSEDAA